MFAVARDPLIFHRTAPTAAEKHALVTLRNRGWVHFFSVGRKTDWWTQGAEPWRVTITDEGLASLGDRAGALVLLGAVAR